MSAIIEYLGGGVGAYMAYRAVRGFGYLFLGRPGYNMIRRQTRRRAVMWRALCRQPTLVGHMATKLDAHKYAAFLNVQMATPEPVAFVGKYAQIAGKKLFFVSIDIAPFVLKKLMPEIIKSRQEKRAVKRRQKSAKASQKRRTERMFHALALSSAGR